MLWGNIQSSSMALFITCVVGKWSIYIWVFSVTGGVGCGGGITSRAHICSNHSKAQSLWRYDRRGKSVLNHLQRNRFSNNLFGLTTKKIKDPYYCSFVKGIRQWLMESPHKCTMMGKAFSCHDYIMIFIRWSYSWQAPIITYSVFTSCDSSTSCRFFLSKMKIFSSKSC